MYIVRIVIFIAHGTFVGSIRVDPHKPVQVLVDTTLAFGASTRRFTLRERPNAHLVSLDSKQENEDADAKTHSLLGLPEEDTELEVRAIISENSIITIIIIIIITVIMSFSNQSKAIIFISMPACREISIFWFKCINDSWKPGHQGIYKATEIV